MAISHWLALTRDFPLNYITVQFISCTVIDLLSNYFIFINLIPDIILFPIRIINTQHITSELFVDTISDMLWYYIFNFNELNLKISIEVNHFGSWINKNGTLNRKSCNKTLPTEILIMRCNYPIVQWRLGWEAFLIQSKYYHLIKAWYWSRNSTNINGLNFSSRPKNQNSLSNKALNSKEKGGQGGRSLARKCHRHDYTERIIGKESCRQRILSLLTS